MPVNFSKCYIFARFKTWQFDIEIRKGTSWPWCNVFVFVPFAGFFLLWYDNGSSWVAFILNLFAFSPECLLRKCNSCFSSFSLKLKHFPIVLIELWLNTQVVCIIINRTDVHHSEIVHKVLPKHKESPVITFFILKVLLFRRRNLWPELPVLLRCSPIPLSFPPRVPQFHHPIWLVVYTHLHISRWYHCISMTKD